MIIPQIIIRRRRRRGKRRTRKKLSQSADICIGEEEEEATQKKNKKEQTGCLSLPLAFVALKNSNVSITSKPTTAIRMITNINHKKRTNSNMVAPKPWPLLLFFALTCSLLLLTCCCRSTYSRSIELIDQDGPNKIQDEATNTTTTTTTVAAAVTTTTFDTTSFLKIPGLYEHDHLITPIQGQANFERLVLRAGYEGNIDRIEPGTVANHISLVQFYMATCPDCQGFSPYFKRFISDIGPHWRHLVRVFVVNCNDDLNINLCWQQNPTLTVPLVRWYTYPILLIDSQRGAGHKLFDYPPDLLNVAHRNYIEKQRRDLISLRHATLRFITSILDQLRQQTNNSTGDPLNGITTKAMEARNSSLITSTATNTIIANEPPVHSYLNENLYRQLPIRWRLFNQIGRPNSWKQSERFIEDLQERARDCLKESGDNNTNTTLIENFIVFERQGSFMGKTLVADWSNWTCSPTELPANKKADIGSRLVLMIHYTNDFSLLNKAKLATDLIDVKDAVEPMLFSFSLISNKNIIVAPEQLQLKLLSSNSTTSASKPNQHLMNVRRRRQTHPPPATKSSTTPTAIAATNTSTNKASTHRQHAEDYSPSSSRLDRLSQRMSLEQYYTRRRSLDALHQHPFRYAASMASANEASLQVLRKRVQRSISTTTTTAPSNSSNAQQKQQVNLIEAENINWAPVELHGNEELLRYQFNKVIAQVVFANSTNQSIPGSNSVLDEIRIEKRVEQNAVVSPKDEDLSLLRLTDYYKVLAEIVHKNLLSKAELDGYQFMSATCFLRQLALHFPFQGGADQQKSIARHYIELVHRAFGDELRKRLTGGGKIWAFDGAFCDGKLLSGSGKSALAIDRQLKETKVTSEELSRIQKEVSKKHDIGLSAEAHFKWSYCMGSGPYLRGHTCSLWVLFHTLTVHEYMNEGSRAKQRAAMFRDASESTQQIEQYKFKVNYSVSHSLAGCNPKNPEPALLNSTTQELFVDGQQYVLANIVNFVRYYLSCTNCAAHFSCMVRHSPSLSFSAAQGPNTDPADHLLWLWEAHNRVNIRTRSTHSEDPLHPKHVFPVYEACPACYLEKPSETSEFDMMKFNKRQLINFIVSRYRRSAILNNKIRIEDLYRKPVTPVAGPAAAASVSQPKS